MSRRLIAISLAIVVLCALAGAGTMAYFTSTATSEGNAFVAGTLKLGGIIDGQDVVERFARLNIGLLRPGEPAVVGTTVLKNVGSLPFKLYRITASDFKGNGWDMLDDVLSLIITIGGEHVFTGKLSELREENGGFFDPIYNVQPGDVKDMEISVMMDASAGNEYQGRTITCDLTVYAAQNNMPNPGEPEGTRVPLGSTGTNLSLLNPGFSVEGYNTPEWVCFDWDWVPNDSVYEYYAIYIKHETGWPTTEIEAERLWVIIDITNKEIRTSDGLSNSDVDVDWDGDVIKIRRSAFPADWDGFEVKLTGKLLLWPEPKEIPYQYWSLNLKYMGPIKRLFSCAGAVRSAGMARIISLSVL